MRTKLRNDKPDPKVTISSTLNELPRRTIPYAERDDPSREKLRKEMVLPMST
jgi:hypothetical protein